MWESLPPVASASVVSADQLTGVSVATHSSGMIGSTAPATCADRTPALTTRSPMPPVAASAASTPSAVNSVATPRDASLNSSPGNAAPPCGESSAHTNLAGGASSPFVDTAAPAAAAASAPPAMVNPFAATSAASSPLRTAASLPSRSFASASASTAGTPLPSGAVMTAVEHVARSGGSCSGAVVHSSSYRIPPPPPQQQQQQDASSSRDGFPTTYTMSGATTVAAAPAPPSQHPRSLSASALQYPAPRHPPPLTPSSTTAANAHASAAAATPAAALGASFMATPTSAARHTAALLPPRTPPESSPMHRSLTSATLAPTTTAASRLDGRTAAAATAITRSVSPRHPHASASTPAHAASASFASQSATNAVWQSPGSISLGSGRLNADAASLYYSPNASEHREGSSSRSTGGGGGGSFFPASGSGDAAARALASAARAAAPLATPDRRYTAVPFNNVNANRESVMMGNSSGSNTAIAAAPVSLSDLRPAAALPTPPPPPMRPPLPAVTPIFSSTEVGGVGGTTVSMVAPPHHQQNSSAHHTNNHSSSGSGGVAESSGVSGTSLTFVSPHFQNAGGAVEVSLTTPTLPVTSQPPPPTGGSSQPPSTSPTMLISAATPAATTTAANTMTATAAGAAFNATVSGSRTGLQGGTPSSFLSRAPAAAVAAQRGGGELVQVVGTEGTASAVASLPPTQPSAAAADPPPCYESLDDARQHHAYSSPPSTRLAEAFTTPGAINSSSVNGGGGGAGGGVLPYEAGASPSSGVGTPPYAATTPLPAPYSQSPAPPPRPAPLPRPPQPVFTSYYSSAAVGGSGGPHPRTSLPSLTPSSQHLCPSPAPAAAALGGLWADPAHTQLTLAQLGVGGAEAAAAHGGGAGGSIASGALPSASMDHNQSFYMGTTGNDNLRRSFFFPPSARGGHGGQHEEASVEDGGAAAAGAATTAAGGSVDGHRLSYDLTSYLRHPAAAAPRSCSTDHPGLSRASSPTNANVAAFPAATTAAYPFSITPPSVNGEVGGGAAAAGAAAAVGGMPASTASAASTETTDGGTSYGSPVLYRVASFPPNASLQPSPSMAGRPGQLSGRSARGGGGGEATLSPGTLAHGLTPPLPPLQQQQQQQQQMPMPVAGGAGGPPVAVPGQPRSSTAEDPLRITVDQRGRPAVTNPSASASSPYMTPHSAVVMPPMAQQQLQHYPGGGGSSVHSARVPQLEESLRATTAHGTNASFLSPTMATSVLRHRFEESILTAHSEASFALPDSSSAVAVNRVNSQGSPVAAAAAVAGGSGGVPAAYQGEATVFSPYTLPPALVSSSALSLPATPQHPAAAAAAAPAFSPPPSAAAAPAAVTSAPAPAYVVDWERSLVAFQNRAESYYTFKNLCTETYLTLVEHDVDRFLVCYYSGGAVKPEEAVQGAVSSRAGTPAATAARVMSSTHDSSTASSSNTAAGSASAGGGGRGGGLQKMIQTNKTLQKLSETGAKWLTNLKRTAMTPMPVSVEPKTPMSSTGTSTPAQEVRSGSSSVGSGSIDPQASTRRPLPQPPVPAAPTNGAADATVRGAAAGTTAVASPSVGSAELGRAAPVAAGDDGLAALYYGGRDPASAASMESGEPTFSYGGPLTGPAGLTGADTGASNGSSIANISSSASRPGSSGGGELSQQLVLDRPLSSSGKSLGGCGAAVDNLSVTSSSSAAAVAAAAAALGVGTPRKQQQPSRLSYNIAADAEMQCLRQLGTYMANVIPDSYMDIRPSEQVLQHVRRNYAILLNALQHVLLMSGVDHPLSEAARGTGGNGGGGGGGGQASQAARALICSRIRQGLLIPSIQATWRDYLAPLEMKAKELVAIATTNIDPILEQLQNTPPDGAGLPAADVEARQRLRALREQPVRRLVRLLRGDEEYLTTIHTMDDEFVEQGEAWRQRSAAMRQSGAALSDYVPVYGLVLSRLHRLEIEHRTVLELWCGGVQAALP